MADGGNLRINHSPGQERYEALLSAPGSDGAGEQFVGYLDYVNEIEQVVLTHTVILDQFSGHGYGSELVTAVLDDIRAQGKKVVPVCTYVRHFISEHPEYQDMAVPVPQ